MSEITQAIAMNLLAPSHIEVREWTVQVASGPDEGKSVKTLDGLVRIGSDAAADLVLTDPTVSRRHLEIERKDRGLLVRDMGSRNGTFIDGRLVMQVFIGPGDVITIGRTKLTVLQNLAPTQIELAGGESFGTLVGQCDAMRAAFAELRKFGQQDVNLLIEGETGTGKELAARAVHQSSARRAGPFRVVDCNLITPEMAERELFGSPKGAEEPVLGVFEAAKGGTVFLDEVGELALELQPKLLRVLETRQLQRPGEAQPVDLNVRIICSTHRNLSEEVRLEHFRADLYFRLAIAKVRLPPLRARRGDIPLLAQHILQHLGVRFELSAQTLSLFEGYDWPGNVRELRNMLERGALMQETGNSNWLDFLAQPPRQGHRPQNTMAALAAKMPYHEAKDRVLADFERVYFAEVMKESGFDIKVAETRTGLSMQSLYRLLKKNGLRLKDLKNTESL